MKFNREGKTPRKFIFTNKEKKDRTIYKIKKMRAKVHVSCRLSLVWRVCIVLLSKLGRENMRLYRDDSNTWHVIMDVKTNRGHTHISLCPPWHVLAWLHE